MTTTNITVEYSTIGRVTICELSSQQGSTLAVGAAICHPTDQFDEILGRAIAFRRALGEAEHVAKQVVRDRTRKVFGRG